MLHCLLVNNSIISLDVVIVLLGVPYMVPDVVSMDDLVLSYESVAPPSALCVGVTSAAVECV